MESACLPDEASKVEYPRSSSIATVPIDTSGSSSTTSTRQPQTVGAATASESATCAAGWVAIGNHIVTLVPLPGSLAICIAPPDCAASPCTIDRPNPVPLPTP